MGNVAIKINSLLTSGQAPTLQSLLERARYLAGLTAALRQKLDGPVAAHITVANIRQETAVILVDSSTWLGKIRYLAPYIQECLLAMGLPIRNVEFKTQPQGQEPGEKPGRAPSMSASSGALLGAAAAATPDERLRAALSRLARHGAGRQGS